MSANLRDTILEYQPKVPASLLITPAMMMTIAALPYYFATESNITPAESLCPLHSCMALHR